MSLAAYLKNGFSLKAPPLKGSSVTFEASIHYYHHKQALINMHALLPCTRLVWILRNPLPRALSEYLHQSVKSKTYPPFHELIAAEVAAINKCRKAVGFDFWGGFENKFFRCVGKFKLKKYLLTTAFYGYFTRAWLAKFPRDQHLFLDYEEFRREPQHTVKEISHFLGLTSSVELNYTWKYNKANTRDGIAKKLRSEVQLSSSLRKKIVREISPFANDAFDTIENNFNWTFDSLV